MHAWLLGMVLLVLGADAFGSQSRGPVVMAAASLQESLTEAAAAWQAEGHRAPVLTFAASSALARQVEAGAPGDLFISADEAWMDHLQKRSLIRPSSRRDLLGNRLVLIAPSSSKVTANIIRGPGLTRALGLHGRMAIADPDAVPAGKYAKAAFLRFGTWQNVSQRVVRAENVRAALALVERAAVPLGVVYATDAKASRAVRVVDVFPESSHPPIVYPIALLKTSKHPDATGFAAFLSSVKGRAIFGKYGFQVR